MKSSHITAIVLALFTLGVALAFTLDGSPVRTAKSPQRPPVPVTLPAQPDSSNQSQPLMEVVFVLDTTGSMSGLIEGAKQKIWSVINDLKTGRPTPRLRIGLVAYRDRGDLYVTRLSQLTEDLDAVYTDLMGLRADGGGDTPESVNQAIHEAVALTPWSPAPDALRIVFLVGDAPPKMYANDIPYTTTCSLAREKDIIINTIQCGQASDTMVAWQSIAALAAGGYATISQDGGMQVAASPYDHRIEELNRAINSTVIPYGTKDERDMAVRKASNAASLGGFAAAERQAYVMAAAPSAAITGNEDLVAEIASGRLEADAIKQEALPDELKSLKSEEVFAQAQANLEKRQKLQQELGSLLHERRDFLESSAASADQKYSFDSQVRSMVRDQAAAKDITYESPAPRP